MTAPNANPIATVTSGTTTAFAGLKELSDANSQGTQLGYSTTDLIGFYGATPVAQATPAGDTTTVTAGSTTAVYVNTSFSGGTGTTAYTIGDVVKVLKGLGLLKA